MAINYSLYSNGNASTRTITVDFAADYLASSSNGVSDAQRYFFKFTTSARDEDNNRYQVRIVENLTDLALNSEKQRISNTAAAYADIKSMIVDYLYDYVHGHAASQWGTTVTAQSAIKFN